YYRYESLGLCKPELVYINNSDTEPDLYRQCFKEFERLKSTKPSKSIFPRLDINTGRLAEIKDMIGNSLLSCEFKLKELQNEKEIIEKNGEQIQIDKVLPEIDKKIKRTELHRENLQLKNEHIVRLLKRY